jgi:hypothetical protein
MTEREALEDYLDTLTEAAKLRSLKRVVHRIQPTLSRTSSAPSYSTR